MKLHRPYLLYLTILLLLLGACQRSIDTRPTISDQTYPIDPAFRQFYNQLGGEDILGEGISPVFEDHGLLYQYTETALLKYDPNQSARNRFQLAPLGRDMGIYELPKQILGDGSAHEVDGYSIPEGIFKLYEQIGGAQVVGKPLTEVHKNTEKNRFDQYFENLGFYWDEGDPQATVRLLAYGAWKCDHYCRHAPPSPGIVNLPSQYASVFVKATAGLGLDFTGYILTAPRLTEDNRLEQVYENLIMSVSTAMPEKVFLMPLPSLVGIQREEPQLPSPAPGMIFYPVGEGLGYNVPVQFYDYITRHGGFEFIGEPITHLKWQSELSAEQCFTNLCLSGIRETDTQKMLVQPVSLGEKYRDLLVNQEQLKVESKLTEDVSIQIWEDYPMISPNQEQEIGVIIQSNGVPVPGVQPELTITGEDGSITEYMLPQTDLEGETSIQLEPVEAENGTLIPYRVCIRVRGGQKFCVVESYLIWQMPYVEVTPELPAGQVSYLPFVVRNLPLYLPAVVNGYTTYIPFMINQQP